MPTISPPPSSESRPSQERGKDIGIKAIGFGILLIPLNIYWIVRLEVVGFSYPTLVVPFTNVIFLFFILLFLNLASGKVLGRRFLNQGELITVYVMLNISSAIASTDMLQVLVSTMGHAFYFATPENEWKELFWDHLPRWLVVHDEAALEGFYNGGTSFYSWQNVKAWLLPALVWLCFIVVLIFMMICLCSILRRQWTEREKLTYPVIRLPLEMSEQKFTFFNNKLMWVGFIIAALISLINGLGFFFPAVPEIPVKHRTISHLFTERPWNLMGGVDLAFYPFVVGVSFLIPLDLLFSCWIFFWYYKAELMFGGLMGYMNLPRFPYQSDQAFGAVISIVLFTLWRGRAHLKNVVSGISGPKSEADVDEPLPYKFAVLGFISGFFLLSIFSSRIGMKFLIVPVFFVAYFLLATFITRMRAEIGLCVHYMGHIEPRKIITEELGTKSLGRGTLTVFALYSFFNRAYRSHPMPHQLEGFKLASSSGIRLRRLSLAMLIAAALTVLVGFWEYLHIYYNFGVTSGYFGLWIVGFGNETFFGLQNWIYYPTGTDWVGVSFMGIGFLISSILMFLRIRFLWFPFHPLGYAMAGDLGMFWCPFFASFVLKWIILKYGGLKLYRRAVPFFLGLMLGDLFIGSVWSIIGIAMDRTIYSLFP